MPPHWKPFCEFAQIEKVNCEHQALPGVATTKFANKKEFISLTMFEHISYMHHIWHQYFSRTMTSTFHDHFTHFNPYLKTRVKHVWNTCFLRVSHVWKNLPVEGACFSVEGACFSVWKPVEIPCFWRFWGSSFYLQFEGGIGSNCQFWPCSPLISIFPGQLESFNCCNLIHDAQGVGPEPGSTGNLGRKHAENGVQNPELFGARKGKSQVDASQTRVWKRRRLEKEDQGDILPLMNVIVCPVYLYDSIPLATFLQLIQLVCSRSMKAKSKNCRIWTHQLLQLFLGFKINWTFRLKFQHSLIAMWWTHKEKFEEADTIPASWLYADACWHPTHWSQFGK